jgi:hypothetical protein
VSYSKTNSAFHQCVLTRAGPEAFTEVSTDLDPKAEAQSAIRSVCMSESISEPFRRELPYGGMTALVIRVSLNQRRIQFASLICLRQVSVG